MNGSFLKDKNICQRAEALLSEMNLDQKIGQMTQPERTTLTPEDVTQYHLGAVLSGAGSSPGSNLPQDWVNMNDTFWAASMVQDAQHMAIPLIYGVDATHGNCNVQGATLFPHNIGFGAANDPDLIKRAATVTARELLATGVEWGFAPMLAVANNIHWGRTYESYSEDPAIVASFAGEFVKGFQGTFDIDGAVACVKHWVGDGGTTNGIDQGETTLTLTELEQTHMTPYYAAIDAGVMTVMVSFNSWNGDKCHSHKHLITDVLKTKLGFEGFVVSDFDGIDYLSEDYYEAVGIAVNAGIDMFMISESWREFIAHLKRHTQRSTVPMQRIDDAVRRILKVKLAYGLFEKPRPAERSWSNHDSFGGPQHRAIAREAVRKSLVLLKNQASLLPLEKHARILVAGKNAHNLGHQCGGFSIELQGSCGNELVKGGSTIWDGIKQVASRAVLSTEPDAADADPDLHDVAIVVIGECSYAEGMGDIRTGDHVLVEAGSQIRGIMNVWEPYGSTLELASLHPEDRQTIETIAEKGIPVVVVLVSGRPLVVTRELDISTAFVAAWLPGTEGRGIADVLFGDFDFQGRLSFSWPECTEDIASHGISERKPLFPLGYGLSYLNS